MWGGYFQFTLVPNAPCTSIGICVPIFENFFSAMILLKMPFKWNSCMAAVLRFYFHSVTYILKIPFILSYQFIFVLVHVSQFLYLGFKFYSVFFWSILCWGFLWRFFYLIHCGFQLCGYHYGKYGYRKMLSNNILLN